MFLVQKVVVVGHLLEISVLTGSEVSVGQRAHLRLVIGFKGLIARETLPLDLPVIQILHNPPDRLVQLIQGVVSPLLQILQQMGFQPLDSLFHGSLSLGLPGRRRQDHHFIELFQILIHRIQDQLVLCVLRNGGTEIVRNQIFGDCSVVVQSMDGAGDKARQLLVGEGLRIDHAADAYGGDEDMHLPQLAGLRVHQKLRLVTDPIDVHPLSGDAFHRHTEALRSVVGSDIPVEVMAELGVLVAGRMLLLVSEPHEVQVCFAALPVDAVVDGLVVRHDVLGFPADIGGRVEGCFHRLAGHLLQDLQGDALFPIPGHDEIHGAVANTVAAAAIVVGDALQAHLDDAKDGCAVLH